jgi:hypothetical protein
MKMNKFLLAAVLTLTSIAPALAQTNQARYSQQSVARLRINATAPRFNILGCVGPYIGTWIEGNPGSSNAC